MPEPTRTAFRLELLCSMGTVPFMLEEKWGRTYSREQIQWLVTCPAK